LEVAIQAAPPPIMPSQPPFISVVVPVFNEAATICQLLDQVQKALHDTCYEIVVVDDGSIDGTTDLLDGLTSTSIRVYCHPRNRGKGAALRTALQHAQGDIIVIQDADLEYDPKDIPGLIKPILDGHADVVYGSRFHGSPQRIHLYWHRVANQWLTWLTNLMFNLDLSDMETGYKAFRKSVLELVEIRENRFGVEPELTAKLARQRCRIYEVPISYYGRDYSQGKKIGIRDAIRAAWCIVRYRVLN
jgi:glycosyltransferase involved in cell wall biosynthesis